MKAILIGNGFTANLISSFGNDSMMKNLHDKLPELIEKVDKKFNDFRELKLNKSDLYIVSECTTFCGSGAFCGDYYPTSDGIHITKEIREKIVSKLEGMGFIKPEDIFEEYFKKYGLIYLINSERIVGVESYMKIVHMYMNINVFSEDDYSNLEKTANEIYYNSGNHGLKSIDHNGFDKEKLISVIANYDDIYTTNYDTVLDDILSLSKKQNQFPYHLHGGFSIDHVNKDPDGRYSPKEAVIIWGKDGKEKYDKFRPGLDFGNINFSAFSFGDSNLCQYYTFLEERKYDEIDILGYSGENDEHINERIRKNPWLKKVSVYVNPEKVRDRESMIKSRILYNNGGKSINLVSWNDFWDKLE